MAIEGEGKDDEKDDESGLISNLTNMFHF